VKPKDVNSEAADDLRRLSRELKELRARLQESEDTLDAIRGGGVDAIVVSGSEREQVFTLAGTENAYRLFVEAMNEGAVTVNPGGTILYANKAFAKLLAKPLEHIVGRPIFDLISVAYRHEFEAVLREARDNSGARCESTLTRDDGEQTPVFISATSCVEFGAKAICMVVTDLSEQKRNEQIVADGKLARLVLSNANEAMAVCDSSGLILHCNRAFQTLCTSNPLRRQFDEALQLEICNSPETTESEKPARTFRVRHALAGQEFRGTEVCFWSDVGEPVHLLLNANPLVLPNMSRAGVLITLFNIEERRRTENALRRSEKLAATGRLAASIAHEINNPLAALTNLVYLIQTESSSPTVTQYARTAQEELGRVTHITRQTLAFYRESNRRSDVNLVELIDSALFLYSSVIRDKNLVVSRDVEFAGTVHGFANELRQVLANVLGNAIEALPKGGSLRIRVYPSREWSNAKKSGVRIVIVDNGQGIKAEHKGRVFEPFFTTKAEKGTGLGLWVSQGIIENHGGFIRLKSSTRPEHRGTVFSIFLPSDQVARRQAVA